MFRRVIINNIKTCFHNNNIFSVSNASSSRLIMMKMSKRNIQSIIVQDLLQRMNQRNIWNISPSASVRDAAKLMEEKKVGALMVIDNKNKNKNNEEEEENPPKGIITARDIQKAVANNFESLSSVIVQDIMTPYNKLMHVHPADNLENVADIMVANNIRHIPVLHDGENIGILSMKDVVREVLELERSEREAMEDIITDNYSKKTPNTKN
jgi:CBS domain-containing protein